jgi:bifunctional UDP-N-acetylglucosamine pyrophosphorylase/glucosamine-1-phosphate N-acetyltransferase
MEMAAVILAAGKGTRMKSRLPKVLHRVCGRPMISHVLDAVGEAGAEKVVAVVGYRGEEVATVLGAGVELAVQAEQLGTAHALRQAEPVLAGFSGLLLVVCGDTPLITGATLQSLAQEHRRAGNAITVCTALIDNPSGYGRIIRGGDGRVLKIVEERDATPDERLAREINTGVYCFDSRGLFQALSRLKPDNSQGEYYLTDIIDLYGQEGRPVGAWIAPEVSEMQGINDRKQLAAAEAALRQRIRDRLMYSGVTILDPATTFIDATVKVGQDTVICPFTVIEGATEIDRDCLIGPSSRLVNARLGSGVVVQHSIVLDSEIGPDCLIGPFAYIRPGCRLGSNVKVGDFVELKKSVIGDDSKVPHLSYIGDAELGRGVNIGAGVITCNYDGKNKYLTTIGDHAFIGSNANLVAPVEVGERAVIGAGSTITKNVPAESLGIARSKQKNLAGWAAGNDKE